jgi:hypothetical protein
MAEFLSPYETSKLLEGVIPADKVARPNWLQSAFGNVTTRETETVNFDVEFATKNTPAMYVAPNADAPLIQLQGYGTKELRFAYVKEGLSSPDYEEINFRQMGQQFGQVDIMANWVANVRKKLTVTEANFENLFELNASNVIFTGVHTAVSEKHPKVYYDFARTKVTTDAGYLAGNVPEIDLTTLNGNGGVGKRAWGSTGGTAAPTPYKDFVKACQTSLRKGPIRAAVLSGDAYELLEADILANFKDAADLTKAVESRIELKILPTIEKYQDLNFRRSIPIGQGMYVDVYTYDAIYHDRTTGVAAKFVPDGYMAILPSSDKGIKIYGRIMHLKARYAAMPRFVNTWIDPKSDKMEAEIHCNYLMGFSDIDAVVSWKVM